MGACADIATNPELYELENRALTADGRLDEALRTIEDWTGRVLLDIGCGTGFWLPGYAQDARRVIGVEPDPALVEWALNRTEEIENAKVRRGSAEHLPLGDASVDLAHARFAYFFGEGAEAGLAEVARVLRPGGALVVVDNAGHRGEFAQLLREASGGNADIDPETTDRWWADHGASRTDVVGGWTFPSRAELQAVLRMELPREVADGFVARHPDRRAISYGFAVFVWRPGRRGTARPETMRRG